MLETYRQSHRRAPYQRHSHTPPQARMTDVTEPKSKIPNPSSAARLQNERETPVIFERLGNQMSDMTHVTADQK